MKCCNNCEFDNLEEIRIVKQLAKAKEIIKDLLSVLPKENIEGVYEVTEEAEEFLKETSNDKEYS